jgi:hypothetical protein
MKDRQHPMKDPIKILVEDDDVDVARVPGERNKDNEKVMSEQNTADTERNHGVRRAEDRFCQNRIDKEGKGESRMMGSNEMNPSVL